MIVETVSEVLEKTRLLVRPIISKEIKMPDLQSILENKINTVIDDYVTITNRCMDGRDLTINEAYEFFTTIQLTRRIYNGTIDCLYQF